MHRVPAIALLLAALLAGCAQPGPSGTGDGSGTGAPSGSITPEPEDSDPAFPGLTLSGEATPQKPWRFTGRAHNAGPESYKVESICTDSWGFEVRDAAGAVVPTGPPEVTCAAFGLGPFEPEEALVHVDTWNGTRWQDGAYVAAAPGHYEGRVSFRVYKGGEGAEYDAVATLTVRLPVVVS